MSRYLVFFYEPMTDDTGYWAQALTEGNEDEGETGRVIESEKEPTATQIGLAVGAGQVMLVKEEDAKIYQIKGQMKYTKVKA